jgi:hypothetical protein
LAQRCLIANKLPLGQNKLQLRHQPNGLPTTIEQNVNMIQTVDSVRLFSGAILAGFNIAQFTKV